MWQIARVSRTFVVLSNKKYKSNMTVSGFLSSTIFFFHHTRNNVELGREIGKKKRGGNARRVGGKEKKERVSLSRWFFVSIVRDNILWANERKSGLVNFQWGGEHDPKTWNACAISEFSFWLMAGVNGLKREGGRQQFLSLSIQRPPMSKWHTASPYSRT